MVSRLTTIFLLLMIVFGSAPALADELNAAGAKRSKWALVVGVSEFQDKSLNNEAAAKNARAFEEYLTNKANFPKEHVKVLLNEQATREAILLGLGMDLASANKEDLVVVYLCSSGTSPNLDPGKVAYILASDSVKEQLFSTGVALMDVPRILKERNYSSNIVVIADCDYSGCAIAGAGQSSLRRAANTSGGSSPIVISSCAKDQTSSGSSFTKHLLDGLAKNGASTQLGDAFNYAKAKVESDAVQQKRKQTPLMEPSKPVNDLALAQN